MAGLQRKVGKVKIQTAEPELDAALVDQIRSEYGQALVDAIATTGKLERYEAIDKVKDDIVAKYATEGDETSAERVAEVKSAFASIEKSTIPNAIPGGTKRLAGCPPDQRGTCE